MDGDKASCFVSSLAKSIQALCNDYIDFSSSIEVIGHIHLNIDRSVKLDYVLTEEVSKSISEGATVFASHSYHSHPPSSLSSKSASDTPSHNCQKHLYNVSHGDEEDSSGFRSEVHNTSIESDIHSHKRSSELYTDSGDLVSPKHENRQQSCLTSDSSERCRRSIPLPSQPHKSSSPAAKRSRQSDYNPDPQEFEVTEIKQEPDDEPAVFFGSSFAGQDLQMPDFSNVVMESLDHVGQVEGTNLVGGGGDGAQMQQQQPFPVMMHSNSGMPSSSASFSVPGPSLSDPQDQSFTCTSGNQANWGHPLSKGETKDEEFILDVENRCALLSDVDWHQFKFLKQKEEEAKMSRMDEKKAMKATRKPAGTGTETKPAKQEEIQKEDQANWGHPLSKGETNDKDFILDLENRLALLSDDDSDPFEFLKQKEEEAKMSRMDEKKAMKATRKPAGTGTETKPAKQEEIQKEDQANWGHPLSKGETKDEEFVLDLENRFTLLSDDDSDPFEFLQQKEEEAKLSKMDRKKAIKVSRKPAGAGTEAEPAKQEEIQKEDQANWGHPLSKGETKDEEFVLDLENRFTLLTDDDSDPFEFLQQKEEEAKLSKMDRKKAIKASRKPAGAGTEAEPAKQEEIQKEDQANWGHPLSKGETKDEEFVLDLENRFTLLTDDDSDPLEFLQQKEEEAKLSKMDRKKAIKASRKPAGAGTEAEPAKQEEIQKEDQANWGHPLSKGETKDEEFVLDLENRFTLLTDDDSDPFEFLQQKEEEAKLSKMDRKKAIKASRKPAGAGTEAEPAKQEEIQKEDQANWGHPLSKGETKDEEFVLDLENRFTLLSDDDSDPFEFLQQKEEEAKLSKMDRKKAIKVSRKPAGAGTEAEPAKQEEIQKEDQANWGHPLSKGETKDEEFVLDLENRFTLLTDDDSDPFEFLQQKEEEAKLSKMDRKKAIKASRKPAGAGTEAEPAKQEEIQKEDQANWGHPLSKGETKDEEFVLDLENRFALLSDDDSDPFEFLKQKEEEAKMSKMDKKKAQKASRKLAGTGTETEPAKREEIQKEDQANWGHPLSKGETNDEEFILDLENRFALLSDNDSDPFEFLQQKEEEAKMSKMDKKKAQKASRKLAGTGTEAEPAKREEIQKEDQANWGHPLSKEESNDEEFVLDLENRFALLSDNDSDPFEFLKQKEEEAKTSKMEKKKAMKATRKPAGTGTETKPAKQEEIQKEEAPGQVIPLSDVQPTSPPPVKKKRNMIATQTDTANDSNHRQSRHYIYRCSIGPHHHIATQTDTANDSNHRQSRQYMYRCSIGPHHHIATQTDTANDSNHRQSRPYMYRCSIGPHHHIVTQTHTANVSNHRQSRQYMYRYSIGPHHHIATQTHTANVSNHRQSRPYMSIFSIDPHHRLIILRQR